MNTVNVINSEVEKSNAAVEKETLWYLNTFRNQSTCIYEKYLINLYRLWNYFSSVGKITFSIIDKTETLLNN